MAGRAGPVRRGRLLRGTRRTPLNDYALRSTLPAGSGLDTSRTRTMDQFTGDRAVDRMEIQYRIYQFFRGIDRLELALVQDAHQPDAHIRHGKYEGGVAGRLQTIEEQNEDVEFCYHHVGSIYIEFEDENSAYAEANVLEWRGASEEILSAWRHSHHITRRDGRW